MGLHPHLLPFSAPSLQDKFVHKQLGGPSSRSQVLRRCVLPPLHTQHEVSEAIQCGKLHPTGMCQPGSHRRAMAGTLAEQPVAWIQTRAPMHCFFSLSFNSSYVKWVVPSSGHSGEADMPCVVKAVQRCSSHNHTNSNNKSSREETSIGLPCWRSG